MKPIYQPKGKAKEYGDYAINIYTGCPHNCFYCFAPSVLRCDKNTFHNNIEPRKNIVEEVKKQVEREKITDKLIHLCFTCDPYPTGYDTTPTREIIKILKESGNHVQILTKNGYDAVRDFDLLDENDWFGITYAGYSKFIDDCVPADEPGTNNLIHRMNALSIAKLRGIKTWVSAEPVLDVDDLLRFIKESDFVDMWKIGKLNYHPSDIDWAAFGKQAEELLRAENKNYYIKESLRKEMEKMNC